MKSLKRMLVVVALASAAVATSGCSYNKFVSQEEAIKTQWAQVENQLQRRNDLIPNLVETTKGFAQQEKAVFQSIADSRAKLAGATTPDQKMAAANEQSSALARLLVVVENYPVLKSDATFARLMDELAGTENRIAVERMSQIFLVAQSVCATLDDTNLVVHAFDETERYLVLRLAIGGDPIPMPIDHLSEFLVGFAALPLQACAPVLEETPCPALALVAPELAEGLLEQVGRVQPLVGRQQRPEGLSALPGEVLATREQRVLLALDVAAILAAEPRILGLAYRVECVPQVAHDVELVEQDRRLRRTPRLFFSPSQS